VNRPAAGCSGLGHGRNTAYWVYSIRERRGWAEHARDYNALVISWSACQEQYQQGIPF
jgi:hypothetical protein